MALTPNVSSFLVKPSEVVHPKEVETWHMLLAHTRLKKLVWPAMLKVGRKCFTRKANELTSMQLVLGKKS
ncbi:hypothetical protein M8C21_026411 [Ambrosia artemisiifolia]|uniref:Uncharacterized protein n=1 Tax=Ambrosia artemisiifolia TaxID=4212 RepID=A0AAD5CGL0_AMBAR|nr:hypothetical protein M8C21_026411 [Ambrosia artemisiifolia]